jgi:hypothetical protein
MSRRGAPKDTKEGPTDQSPSRTDRKDKDNIMLIQDKDVCTVSDNVYKWTQFFSFILLHLGQAGIFIAAIYFNNLMLVVFAIWVFVTVGD